MKQTNKLLCYCDFMKDTNYNFITFNIFKFQKGEERLIFIDRWNWENRFPRGHFLKSRKWLFPSKVCQHERQRRVSLPPIIWGEKSLLLRGEKAVWVYTSQLQSSFTFDHCTGTLLEEYGGNESIWGMLKLSCGFEGCNTMKIVSCRCN